MDQIQDFDLFPKGLGNRFPGMIRKSAGSQHGDRVFPRTTALPEIPPAPPEAVKKFRQREIGGPGMPGGGANSRRPNRRWFLRGRRGIYPTEAEVRISLFLLEYCQIAGVARRKSGKRFADIYLPPGFGGVNLPLPRPTRKAFPSLHLNFFTASLFQTGEMWNLSSTSQKALLPLKKGGGEGFLGTPFQNAKVLP
jgi:hypothetical protein